MPIPFALVNQLQGNTMYDALMRYLDKRARVPEVTVSNRIGDSQFSSGGDLPPAGEITLGAGGDPGSLLHELTHAADRQLVHQYYEPLHDRSLPRDPQFEQAFEKLFAHDGRKRVAQALGASQFLKDESDYRATGNELGAWAVGRMAGSDRSFRAPPHVDPTLATETAILLELASRKAQPSRK